MKVILTLSIIIAINCVVIAQRNQALYTIPDVNTILLDQKSETLYSVLWKDDAWKIISYNITNGSKNKEFGAILPENPIHLMIEDPQKNILYFLTSKKIANTDKAYCDAIYSFNPKKDKVKFLYKVKYDYPVPNKIGLVDKNIVFTTMKEPTRIYNLKDNFMEVLNQNTDYQLLNIAPEEKGYIMLNTRNIEGDKIPIYFMDTENNIKEKLGYYHPNINIESAKKSFQIPDISLESETYNWIVKPIRYNCFPLKNFQITMRPFWLKQAYNLDKIRSISTLLAGNDNYIVAKANNDVIVYKTMKDENMSKPFTLEEISDLETYFSTNTYTREVIDSDIIENVFDAVFCRVYYRNKFKYIAVLTHGNYIKLDDYEHPKSLIGKEFKITDGESAKMFQDALDIILPPDSFNRNLIKFEQKENQWIFTRGQAFERKFGYLITTDELGSIIKIEYLKNL